MTTNTYRYLSEISSQEFQNAPVLPFRSEDGRPCVLIRNKKEKTVVQTGTTDNIEYHLNSTVEKDGSKYCFHIISCIKNDQAAKEQFEIAYQYLFKKIKYPQTDLEITKLISSLEQLFKVTPEADKKKLQIGVYGELLFLIYIYENGYESILSKYHSYFYSKHDIEIDNHNRIEIKTSVNAKRIHAFRHDQLYRTDIKVFVGSLILEYSQEGVSLYELFEKVIGLITNPDDLLDMGSLKNMCDISEDKKGPSFSYNRALEEIKIFDSEKLPHLTIGNVNGVTNVAYDVDCGLADSIKLQDFISYLKSLGVENE